MSTRSSAYGSLIFLVITIALGLFLRQEPARAATILSSSDSSCLGCHEDLYYLHDLGKWYCLSEASTRCVDCHGGNPDSPDKEASHEGLIEHPVLNGDVSRCMECHPRDCNEHLQKFDQIAGISPVVYVSIAYTPAQTSSVLLEQPETSLRGRISPYLWQVTGVTILFLLFGGIWLFCRSIRRHQHE